MFEQSDLIKLANQRMPFGRFKGSLLIRLPEEYLLWFVDRGFPTGKLGELMQLTLEIKINGLESLIYPLCQSEQGQSEQEDGLPK
jgi:uncharacterized protein